MTERTVYLAGWQVHAALENRLSVLFVPINPRPYMSYGPDGEPDALFIDSKPEWFGTPGNLLEFSPFAPGDTLLCKEAWGMWAGKFIYRTDPGSADWGWRSPVHMPREAVRIKFAVEGVEAVEVRKITVKDVIAAGISKAECGNCVHEGYWPVRAFAEKWETRYRDRYPWDTAWAWRLEVIP